MIAGGEEEFSTWLITKLNAGATPVPAIINLLIGVI